MRAHDQVAADASGPLAADPTAASDDRRRGRQVRRRTTPCGGERLEVRRSPPDLERPTTVWDAAEPYA
jgi:hypothetical protein